MLPPLKYSRLCGNDIALYAALLPHSWESRKVIAEFPIEALKINSYCCTDCQNDAFPLFVVQAGVSCILSDILQPCDGC